MSSASVLAGTLHEATRKSIGELTACGGTFVGQSAAESSFNETFLVRESCAAPGHLDNDRTERRAPYFVAKMHAASALPKNNGTLTMVRNNCKSFIE